MADPRNNNPFETDANRIHNEHDANRALALGAHIITTHRNAAEMKELDADERENSNAGWYHMGAKHAYDRSLAILKTVEGV